MLTRYKYRGLNADGKSQEGVITAASEPAVLEYMAEQDLIPLKIETEKRAQGLSMWGFFRGQHYDDLISFTKNLATLYRAGIPLLRALTIVKVGPPESRFNAALDQIRLGVQSGRTLSSAIAEHDDIFPTFYSVSIAAGEESGKLEEILEQLSDTLRRELDLTRQIKSGVRYPAMVVVALVAAMVVMLTFVVPKFMAFYSSFGAELPIATRLLIGTSELFSKYWIPMLAGLIGGAFIFNKLLANPKFRLKLDRLMLKIPVVGDLIIKGNVARFALMFQLLLHSGLPMIRSLEVLRDTVKNTAIAIQVGRIKELLELGRGGELLNSNIEYFPDLSLRMMAIGLESGSLDTMLRELGDHFSKEVRYMSQQLTAILEPLLTVVMGGFILVLALAIFLPMWNLIKVFGAH
jgi:MSHA biogenesis protein MshG